MVELTLALCLTVAAPGVCRAETDHVIRLQEPPPWATEEWTLHCAHIVASEARGVPIADCVIARNLVLDVESERLSPWGLSRRWYGYGPPDDADIRACRLAIHDLCGDIPHYRFVGNLNDLATWRARGYVGEQHVDLYLGQNGKTVVGVP